MCCVGLRLLKLLRTRLYPLFWALVLGVSGSASAHAYLVDTTPQAGERLQLPPSEFVLHFSEPIVGGTEQVTIRTADDANISLTDLAPIDGGLRVRAALPGLEKGVYSITWQVMADDTHLSAGELAFAVGEGGELSATATSTTGTVAWPEALGGLLLFAGLVTAVGGLASERFVWQPVAARLGLALPRAQVVASLLLALTGVVLQMTLLQQGQGAVSVATYLDAETWLVALRTRPGILSAVTLGLLVYGLWLSLLPGVRAWALLPLSGTLIAAAYRGHAGTLLPWWAAPVNALHLLLAGLWIGALLHLVQVLWQLRGADAYEALRVAAQRYDGLALVLVPPLLAAGVVTALPLLGRPAALLATPYGRVLSVKLLLVTAALGLALVARLRALVPLRLKLLRRLTGAEGAALLLVVAVSALLASSAPPQSPQSTPLDELLGPAPLTGPVLRLASLPGQLALFLAAAEDQLQLRVAQPSGEPAEDVRVEVSGRGPDGVGFDLYPRACGHGCFTMDFGWKRGVTALTVAVAHETWLGGQSTFEVPWPPGPDGSKVLTKVIETMGGILEFTMTEQVSSGPGATSPTNTFRVPNPFFISEEVYARGGATDVRMLPTPDNASTRLVLFLPGSFMWYELWIDSAHRLRRERIINPGHRIERTFSYGP